MRIIIKFVNPVRKEKVLHNLRNVKKITPILKNYIPQIHNYKFSLLDENQKEVCSCKLLFPEEGNIFLFSGFSGDYQKEFEKMLTQTLIEEIGEKAFIRTFIGEKKVELYYDLDDFFVASKGKIYQLGSDGEKLLEIEAGRVPREIKGGIKS